MGGGVRKRSSCGCAPCLLFLVVAAEIYYVYLCFVGLSRAFGRPLSGRLFAVLVHGWTTCVLYPVVVLGARCAARDRAKSVQLSCDAAKRFRRCAVRRWLPGAQTVRVWCEGLRQSGATAGGFLHRQLVIGDRSCLLDLLGSR